MKMSNEFGINDSVSTIGKSLSKFYLSLKCLVNVPVRRNCETTIQKRSEYAKIFKDLETTVRHENFISIDEVGFSVVYRPKRGRLPSGQSVYCYFSAARSRNISVVAAVNKSGVILSKIHERALNGESFKTFLIELKSLCNHSSIENPIFNMENARIYHYRGPAELIESENLVIRYLPPYSPFLNPIENVFSV